VLRVESGVLYSVRCPFLIKGKRENSRQQNWCKQINSNSNKKVPSSRKTESMKKCKEKRSHQNHHLTIQQRVQVLKLVDGGMSYRDVANMFKISHGTVPGEDFSKIELEFIKHNILIRFDIISNKVMIDKADSTEENVNFYNVKTLYHGECKDINTFRKIIKLLDTGV
jgi:hypothetical protein